MTNLGSTHTETGSQRGGNGKGDSQPLSITKLLYGVTRKVYNLLEMYDCFAVEITDKETTLRTKAGREILEVLAAYVEDIAAATRECNIWQVRVPFAVAYMELLKCPSCKCSPQMHLPAKFSGYSQSSLHAAVHECCAEKIRLLQRLCIPPLPDDVPEGVWIEGPPLDYMAVFAKHLTRIKRSFKRDYSCRKTQALLEMEYAQAVKLFGDPLAEDMPPPATSGHTISLSAVRSKNPPGLGVPCKYCGSTDTKKNGRAKLKTGEIVQYYKCNECDETFKGDAQGNGADANGKH